MDVRKRLQATSLVAWSIAGTMPIYVLIVEFVRIQNEPFHGFSPDLVGDKKDLYYGLAIILLLAVGNLKNSLLKKQPEDDLEALVKKLFLSTVITFSLCVLPAILGLVFFLLGGLYKEFYILSAFSAFVMLAHFPRYRD